jgi:hypothetical protein
MQPAALSSRRGSRLHDEDERRNTAIRASLRQVPRFDLRDRT